MMEGRIRKVWVETPENDVGNWLEFRIAAEWYSTGGQKVTMPVKVLDRYGEQEEHSEDEYLAILDQFGGAELLLDIMEAGGLTQGDVYRLEVYPDGDRSLSKVETDDGDEEIAEAAEEVVEDA